LTIVKMVLLAAIPTPALIAASVTPRSEQHARRSGYARGSWRSLAAAAMGVETQGASKWHEQASTATPERPGDRG
jgi:hypothetical protein